MQNNNASCGCVNRTTYTTRAVGQSSGVSSSATQDNIYGATNGINTYGVTNGKIYNSSTTGATDLPTTTTATNTTYDSSEVGVVKCISCNGGNGYNNSTALVNASNGTSTVTVNGTTYGLAYGPVNRYVDYVGGSDLTNNLTNGPQTMYMGENNQTSYQYANQYRSCGGKCPCDLSTASVSQPVKAPLIQPTSWSSQQPANWSSTQQPYQPPNWYTYREDPILSNYGILSTDPDQQRVFTFFQSYKNLGKRRCAQKNNTWGCNNNGYYNYSLNTDEPQSNIPAVERGLGVNSYMNVQRCVCGDPNNVTVTLNKVYAVNAPGPITYKNPLKGNDCYCN